MYNEVDKTLQMGKDSIAIARRVSETVGDDVAAVVKVVAEALNKRRSSNFDNHFVWLSWALNNTLSTQVSCCHTHVIHFFFLCCTAR